MRLTVALATVFVPAAVFAAPNPLTQWTACSDDSQCVAIQGTCNPTAVNVAYDKPAQVYFNERAAKAKCVQQFWQPKLQDARAKCWQGSCQIVGKD